MATNIAPRLFLRSYSLAGPLRKTYPLTRLSSASVRTYVTPTAPVLKDAIQELYIQGIKAYVPEPTKVDAAEVKHLSLPTPPKAPVFNEDITQDLASYEFTDKESESKATAAQESVFEYELFGPGGVPVDVPLREISGHHH
ncbi:10463_t:CDS:2 [Ambispora gerdemannii]|uniref:10463_t:CDS:1 n=1 Tax=Ambispora gerdemannii TaxID=144530 RepID=A0A9N8WFF0_9GLOM|nr:10463_t:CDS:2 [Ambispora gerdemannii]